MARQTIDGLLQETGHTLTLEDFSDVAELNEIAHRVMHPDDLRAFRLLSRPVQVGETGVFLRPASISRIKWIADYSADLFPDEVMQYASMVFALSVEDPRCLYDLNETEIQEEVQAIAESLDVVPEELIATMGKVMRMAGGEESTDDPDLIYGPVIASLVREYGSTPDYWLHEATMESVEAMLDDLQRRNESEQQASAAAVGAKHFARVYLNAMAELRAKEVELLQKWQAA